MIDVDTMSQQELVQFSVLLQGIVAMRNHAERLGLVLDVSVENDEGTLVLAASVPPESVAEDQTIR